MHDLPLTYAAADGWSRIGTVTAVSPTSVAVDVPGLSPGATVRIDRDRAGPLTVEVIAVEGRIATCAALGDTRGIEVGSRASSTLTRIGAYVGSTILGCAVDAWGRSSNDRRAPVAALQKSA